MKIQLKEITIKQLFEGYEDRQESGVVRLRGEARHSPAVSARVHLQRQAARCRDRYRAQGFPLCASHLSPVVAQQIPGTP